MSLKALHNQEKVLVVGAGIAGLSAALLLARAGKKVEIWEAAKQGGGLLAPVDFCGIACDRGSHRIHPQSDPILLELTSSEEWRERPRKGKLILNQRHIPYPPSPLKFLKGLGPMAALDMGLGFVLRPNSLRRFTHWEMERSKMPLEDEGFEEFVLQRVGKGAYERFYRPYAEKVWGEEPAKLSRTVAKQRVSTSAPWQTLLGALQKPKKNRSSVFLYPRRGMTGLLQSLRYKVEEAGVQMRYAKRFSVESFSELDFGAVFFSGHLSDLVDSAPLKHRGLYLLHMSFPTGTVGEEDTFYSPEKDYWFGRVSQIERFSPDLRVSGKNILCVEIPEGRWGSQQDFTKDPQPLLEQLQKAQIIREGASLLDIKQTFIPRVYPIYRRGWFQDWKNAMQVLQEHQRIWPIGRQGLFLHCNMDHCVRISQDAVSHLLEGGNGTSWIQKADQYLDLRVRD